MNWIKVEDGLPPTTPPCLDPCTDEVWVYTDYHYAQRFGMGQYDYEAGQWFTQGCRGNVTHWAIQEKPQNLT